MPIRLVALPVAGLLAVALLSGCSSDNSAESHRHDDSTAQHSAAHNSADVMFLQMMYPHHAQAVEMAQLVPGRSTDPELTALAGSIEKAQAPEMTRIAALLRGFGQPEPTAGGMHSGHHMPGIMSDADMKELKTLSGKAFDKKWVTMMIEHHQGAIDMSNTELSDGTAAEPKRLAQTIITAQQSEISHMRDMLRRF